MDTTIKDGYASPRWSNEIIDCSMPMTFDTYNNCSFGCRYCFSQNRRAIGNGKEAYLSKEASCVSVKRVKDMFIDPDRYAGQFAEYIKERRVMQWGGLSDAFDGFEKKYGVSLELLRFFKEIDYPLCFSTKGVWWTKDERYMELFRGQKNWNVKFSVITLEEDKARKVEVGVPTPNERLAAMERISSAECGGVTLRLRPFILGISTPSYLQLIKRAADVGASAVSTEFLCVELRSNETKRNLQKISEIAGVDLLEFYKKHSLANGYLRLNRAIKEPFMMNMKHTCDNLGLRFYVSDAHWKELSCNGSCCGLSVRWNYCKGQFTEALLLAKRKGTVKWSDISKEASLYKHIPYIGASGFNTKSTENRAKFYGMNMYDYIRHLWNSPKDANSPYRYFGGILYPVGYDGDGDIIYEYKGR